MRNYQLRAEPASVADGSVRMVKVYRRASLMFLVATCERRGVDLTHHEKDGFNLRLCGDPAAVAAALNDFDTRPL